MNDDDNGAFNERTNEQDRILREHGYDPKELSQEEKDDLLMDLQDESAADNDEPRSVTTSDERDGT